MNHITCSLRRWYSRKIKLYGLFFFALRDSISQYVKPSQKKTPIYKISHSTRYSESNNIPGIPQVGTSHDAHKTSKGRTRCDKSCQGNSDSCYLCVWLGLCKVRRTKRRRFYEWQFYRAFCY
jgi:hypothetical protein